MFAFGILALAVAAQGPHAVGYRVIDYWDRSRHVAPARDYQGRANAGDRATPMQVSVWYPAKRGGTPMRIGEYHAIGAKRQTLGGIVEADVGATAASVRAFDQFALGLDLPAGSVDSIIMSRANAVRDAAAEDGRFPLIVGGLAGPGSAYGLAEYLASYGYVVVTSPSLAATATLQVTKPQIAVETQTRNMEVIEALALALPFVDSTRIALVGANFDGLAALTHQMRNMSAGAVISIDGWESSASAEILRASPYFDPARIRVPYLAFAKDNAPSPNLVFRDSLLRQMKYSDRYAYVLKDMEHSHWLRNLLVYPQLSADRRLGYDFAWRTMRAFLDATLKGDSASRAFIGRSAVQNDYPPWLARVEIKHAALPPIPTAEEVEEIAMRGAVAELRAVHRRARANDPTVAIFTPASLSLFAFRFAQRGDSATALALSELASEVFPSPTAAANDRRASNQSMQCAGSASLAGYAMTYDPDRRQVVIFGGLTTDDTSSAATWGWDGQTWQCITPASATGPSPRNAAMLAYDARRHVLVLYGGRVGRQALSDTWELSASGWQQRSSTGPTPDPHGVLAFDEAVGGVLLFHSLGDDSPTRATWRWDGATWTKVAEGPNEQLPDAMFASRGEQPTVLITARSTGVHDAFNPPLYQWRDNRWRTVTVSGAIPVFSPQAPAARTATGALLFAGFEPDGSVTTWILDGTIWRRYTGASPSRRRNAQMVFDPQRSVVVLHAGYDGARVLTDTWEWDGTRWRKVL